MIPSPGLHHSDVRMVKAIPFISIDTQIEIQYNFIDFFYLFVIFIYFRAKTYCQLILFAFFLSSSITTYVIKFLYLAQSSAIVVYNHFFKNYMYTVNTSPSVYLHVRGVIFRLCLNLYRCAHARRYATLKNNKR